MEKNRFNHWKVFASSIGIAFAASFTIMSILNARAAKANKMSALEDTENKIYLPAVVYDPTIKSFVTELTVTLPQPLEPSIASWCTWSYCSISPRLYHEPLSDGRTMIGWTDSSYNGHVSVIGLSGGLDQTYDFPARSIHGLVAHADSTFAVLLWNAGSKVMWLSNHGTDGAEIWKTNLDHPDTSFNPNIGDSRLSYGDRYAAYFAVHGDSSWMMGHEGDALTYVSSSGVIMTGGWYWGCSHSMAELVVFHPVLNKFVPICSSDCYPLLGILSPDYTVIPYVYHLFYPSDANCAGYTSAQLGQIALSSTAWKLVFNALNRPGYEGKGIGLATIESDLQSSYIWLTNTDGSYERDPVIARLGSALDTDRYLVGWKTINDNAYWLGVIDGSGNFLEGPEEVSLAGIAWGNRDDSFRTRPDGSVSWVQGDPSSTILHLFLFNGSVYLP